MPMRQRKEVQEMLRSAVTTLETGSTKRMILTSKKLTFAQAMPRKVRQLIRDLERAGFVNRGGKGNHRNFVAAQASFGRAYQVINRWTQIRSALP